MTTPVRTPGTGTADTGPGRALRSLLATIIDDVPAGRSRVAFAIVLSALASGASVGLMATSAWLLSRANEHPPVLMLMVAVTSVRAFGISRGFFRYVERLVAHDLALHMQSALRLRVYRALRRSSLLGRRHGDLVVRVVTDVQAVMDAMVRVLVPFSAAGVVVAGTTVLFLALSPATAVVVAATALLAGLVIPWWTRTASRRADASVAPLRGEMAGLVAQLHRTAPDVVAYGAQAPVLARIEQVNDRLTAAEERASWVRGVATGLHVLATGAAVLGALAIGGREVVAGTLAPVALAVLVLTPFALHEILEPLSEAAQTWTRVRGSLGRVAEVLALPATAADVDPQRGPGGPRVELEGLEVGWPGSGPVVTGLDLQVGAGERVGLVGASGIGKTTVAATIMGLIPPRDGAVRVQGTVGYLAQDAHVFDTSVAENVRIGNKDATDDEVRAALARAGLDLAPERTVGEHAGRISGGEARRLALARLFVGRADVLVLDEPTEHLDEPTADALMADLWRATRDDAVLVVTHDPRVMEACDRLVHLDGPALDQRP